MPAVAIQYLIAASIFLGAHAVTAARRQSPEAGSVGPDI